jgi:hypothetical protein
MFSQEAAILCVHYSEAAILCVHYSEAAILCVHYSEALKINKEITSNILSKVATSINLFICLLLCSIGDSDVSPNSILDGLNVSLCPIISNSDLSLDKIELS